MPFRIAVHRTRVQPADHVGAFGKRPVHQVEGSGALQQAGLREGHDLDVNLPGKGFARALDALEAFHTAIGIHIDMAADRSRTLCQ